MARGLTREQATREVRVQFEGPVQVKEKVREASMGTAVETMLRDLQYAWRVLWKTPSFTIVAVLTLRLGIGANTAIFSLINAVMLRMLPVEHPEQLVMLTDPTSSGASVDTTEHGIRERLSYPEFQELRSHNTAFTGMFAAQNEVVDLDAFPGGSNKAQSIRARTQLVSGEFFPVLGVRAVLGRVFTPDEDRAPGANPVAVISYDFWQRSFAAQPNVLGTTMRVGQGVFQIIGLAPPGFHGVLVDADTDVWFPIAMQAEVLPGRDYLKPRDTLWLQVAGRLAPGTSLPQAQAAVNVTFQQILQGWAAALPTEKERRGILDQKIQLQPGARGASHLRGQFSDPLLLLMAMVGVVLLIACANIANLMLARANGRQRELGVRLALGAARARLIRQLLTESLVVAAFGGILGILLAAAGTRVLLALVSAGISDLALEVPRDYHVLLFTAAISLATCLVFGIAPAIRATGLDVSSTLAANVRGAIGGRGRAQSGRVLVVAQVALSVVLLMGAGLFMRSLHKLLAQNLGYETGHMLMLHLDPIAAGYKESQRSALDEKVREGLRAIPGVSDVTYSNVGLFRGDSGDHLTIEGSVVHDPEKSASRWTEVGPDYFKTMGIPVVRGREIDGSDAARATPVCFINESFLKIFFAGANPIGKHIRDEYPTTRETFEIVGVVADAREHGLSERKWPRFYSNLAHPIGFVESVTFLVRSSGDPAGVAAAARQAVLQIDPSLPILIVLSVNEQIDRHLVMERLVAELAAFFGAIALFMAAIGLYGVMSYSMSRRTSEIGIRMALGASGTGVIRMVFRETLGLVVIGTAIGLPCAIVIARLLKARLFGLTAADPVSMAFAILVVLMAAVLAGYVPARRASRIDPMLALRCE